MNAIEAAPPLPHRLDHRTTIALVAVATFIIAPGLVQAAYAPAFVPVRLALPWVLIAGAVGLGERGCRLPVGLAVHSWRRTLLAMIFTPLASLAFVFVLALILRRAGDLRIVDGWLLYLGMSAPLAALTPRFLLTGLIGQIVTAALPEELLCRGYLLPRLLLRWRAPAALAALAAVSALAHWMTPLMMPHNIIAGLIFGLSYYYCGNIYPAFFAHYLSNTAGALILKAVALS